MKRFFRSALTLNYSTQLDAAQTAIPGTFLFGGVDHGRRTLYDLAKQIAAHPRFKIAWTKKLCAWANSHAATRPIPSCCASRTSSPTATTTGTRWCTSCSRRRW